MIPGNHPSSLLDPLPIDSHIPEIISRLRESSALVLTAPPGAGKTTRIPRALYEHGFAGQGEIVILEPRRLAARLAAARVAQELGEKLGETVGYSIRHENVAGPRTRIRFLTEAILARRMVHDPSLQGVSTVIIDEFHERHLTTDLALGFLQQLQQRNPQLKIIVMSATLDAAPVTSFLSDAFSLSVAGSPFDLSIEYEEKPGDRPLHDKVAAAVSRLLRSGINGDILVFLPGSAEIRRAADALKPIAERARFQLLLLHGDLPLSEQKRAVEPAAENKVILATNVAETSITIPGIAAVIDSGLVRVAGHSAWSGFSTLSVAKISKSSAIQRAGRAGRTREGRVLRLYTRLDFDTRSEHETPEIKRADLSETALLLHGAGFRDLSSFSWFEPPPKPSLEAAESLLVRLEAIDEAGRISETGRRMLELPVHPRLARMIVEGEKLQVRDECALLAALLSERDIRLDVRAKFGSSSSSARQHSSGPSDLLELLDCYREAEDANFESGCLRDFGLDARTVHAVRRGYQQLRKILFRQREKPSHRLAENQIEEALLIATLAAFPDRVAKRRKAGSRELVLAGGGSAILTSGSVVHNPMFLVAIDVEERKEKMAATAAGALIRLASAIEIEWLAALFPQAISQKTGLFWNDRAGRVDEIRRTEYGGIALEETIKPASPSREASSLLASAVLARGFDPLKDVASLSSFLSRLALVSGCFPEEKWPEPGDQEMREIVSAICVGRCRLEELAAASLVDALVDSLTHRQRALLLREAPEKIKLKSGRTVPIHYESEKPPWIESRLQDFFGTHKTPSICGGQVSLTVHLLAPNRRPVQVTQDLAGFWKKHYPEIRRELQRRYPKHAWPDPESLIKG